MIETKIEANELRPAIMPFVLENSSKMYHGKPTDALTSLTKKTTNITGDITVMKSADATVELNIGTNDLKKSITEVHKLLSYIVIKYTEKKELVIKIKIEEYLSLKNYKTEKENGIKNTNNIKEAKKELRKTVYTLNSINIEWTESSGNKYSSRRLISGYDIDKKYLTIYINELFADYLNHCPLTMYPLNLISIKPENDNAYRIGNKLSKQYSNKSNIKVGTNNRLQVSTILSATTIDVNSIIKNDKNHWQRRIKEVLENNLNILKNHILVSWKYTGIKGTTVDIDDIDDIESYMNLYIEFKLKEETIS